MQTLYGSRQQQKIDDNDSSQDYHLSFATLLIHSLIIAVLFTFTISFLILISYFINQNVAYSSSNQQMQIFVSVVLWLMSTVAIIVGISKQLALLHISNFLFMAVYVFSTLPVIQLTIDILKKQNDGTLATIPFILSVLLTNIIFITTIMFYLSKTKMSSRKIKIMFIVLILFCIAISCIDTLFR
jgi:hypothetical protein